jgi:hypothetical protein
VLEGQVLEHVLRLGKIEVVSARARYRAPNAQALLIIGYNELTYLNFGFQNYIVFNGGLK